MRHRRLEMKESVFQFTNPALTQMEFLINDGFDSEKKSVKMRVTLNVNILPDNNNNNAKVSLTCELGEQNKESPFWLKVVEQANFKWNKDINETTKKKLLNQNAPALLLSYLRPIVSQITASSMYGAYNIPFCDFTIDNDKSNF